jgi:hypothetical protein
MIERSKKCEMPRKIEGCLKQIDMGINVFSLKKGGNFEFWEQYVRNVHDYRSTVIRFAARWANMMESQMIKGKDLKDIAEETRHKADFEGISACMYEHSISILSEIWKYGGKLRRWHEREIKKAKKSNGIALQVVMG